MYRIVFHTILVEFKSTECWINNRDVLSVAYWGGGGEGEQNQFWP